MSQNVTALHGSAKPNQPGGDLIPETVPEIIAAGGVAGLVYFGQWTAAALIALAVILWYVGPPD